eukprot:CAMPEP_0198298812 /NCGR_PEP_ID=MMETSP1449-20131203/42248_1 /TAXON_ID=420275 /ORGANISM="Attheya septentrionalis, Strain CCMP2084" /LENGTH=74 /DNA_ID=CAMNT_0044000185 /DNA_START=153 /DNA_END=374 /DNA_ORIENTATION=-
MRIKVNIIQVNCGTMCCQHKRRRTSAKTANAPLPHPGSFVNSNQFGCVGDNDDGDGDSDGTCKAAFWSTRQLND